MDTADFLDVAAAKLREAPLDAGNVIRDVAAHLRAIKLGTTREGWSSTIAFAREHELRSLVHEDPLTWRAFSQPRGYQGDAELLDLIYSMDYSTIGSEVSKIGRSIFAYTIECQAPAAVRERMMSLAKLIDATATHTERPDVLAVACGHLRELEQSRAFKEGGVGRFVGLDQDPASIAHVERRFGPSVETVEGSIKLLLGGALSRQQFDLIYCAGLYDYLEERIAQRLTERMFDMLRTGGRLLFANYLPSIPDVGYMETYMGWELIYRTDTELTALTSGIPKDELLTRSAWRDSKQNIGFIELVKQ